MRNTVLHYLEETAEKYPDKVAITDENGSIAFSKLRKSALSVASAICAKLNGRSHSPIFVYLPKSKECIASFLGIMYSGNIYTPSDVKFPFPKIQGILNVLKPSIYISDLKHAEVLRINGINEDSILIYEDISALDHDFNASAAIRVIIDTDPVYILFTSGSTGVPKGVLITHRSIINHINWVAECFCVDETHIIGNQVPFYFDMSILDIYLCIKTGAHMHIIPESYFSFPVRLMQYVEESEINFIFWVPSVLSQVANRNVLEDVSISSLKKILFAGEVMPTKQLNYWRNHLPNAMYANLFGPTETTNIFAYHVIDSVLDDNAPIPIGKPCSNTSIMLLDKSNSVVTTPNTRGELCIRGTSLSPGYWDNAEKTSEAFIQNPLNPHYPEKIYRTGDLAFYNDKMELMFAGRKDFQIKHLGRRIELGEIEVAALSVDGVDTTSADYDKETRQIVLFYSGNNITENVLRKSLYSLIPKYMVPARYIKLDKFPYNDNGKINRKSLRGEYIG